jgi:hypothetical protein
LEERAVPSATYDFLYVGDGTDNTVKQFDATTGAFVGTLVRSGSQGMLGAAPRRHRTRRTFPAPLRKK